MISRWDSIWEVDKGISVGSWNEQSTDQMFKDVNFSIALLGQDFFVSTSAPVEWGCWPKMIMKTIEIGGEWLWMIVVFQNSLFNEFFEYLLFEWGSMKAEVVDVFAYDYTPNPWNSARSTVGVHKCWIKSK